MFYYMLRFLLTCGTVTNWQLFLLTYWGWIFFQKLGKSNHMVKVYLLSLEEHCDHMWIKFLSLEWVLPEYLILVEEIRRQSKKLYIQPRWRRKIMMLLFFSNKVIIMHLIRLFNPQQSSCKGASQRMIKDLAEFTKEKLNRWDLSDSWRWRKENAKESKKNI